MEIIENTLKVLDTSRITIVRSSMNNKMLLVDGYMYQYEDRGLNTIRWICKKRKEENCRAHLITTPVVGDDTSHVVVRIDGSHKCIKSEINKSLLCKQAEGEEVEKKYNPKKVRAMIYEREQQKLITSDEEEEEEEEDGDNFNDEVAEYVEDEEDDAEELYVNTKTIVTKSKFEKQQEKSIVGLKSLSKFERNKVYVLRTQHDRELVLVDGFLYRLEGKSKTSATFRWECIRSDINCKTRIYTERHSDTNHSLKHLAGAQTVHEHQPYTPNKMTQLIKKHKITLMQDQIKPKIKDEPNYVKHIPHYAITPSVDDPLTLKIKNSTPLNEDRKITLLPSAKGNKEICVGKMIYHFDTKSPCKRRTYWTCYYRHHKQYKCKSRLITENSNNGISIKKITGSHNHANHSAEIKQRLNMMSKEKKIITEPTSAKKLSQKTTLKSIISKALEMSGYDSSTSCSSLLSDTPNLPERLEDMRQDYTINEDSNIELAPPEHITFVDPIECDILENEHSYDALNERNIDQLDSKSNIPKKRGRKCYIPLEEQSYDDFNETDYQQLDSKSNIQNWHERKPKIQLQQSIETLNEIDYGQLDSKFNIPKKRGRKRKVPIEDLNDSDYNQNDSKIKKRIKRERNSLREYMRTDIEYDMDVTKISQLRSAKGGTLLCVDGYIYHMKSEATRKNYWICIKNRDYSIKCKSFVTTSCDTGDIQVVHVTNKHNHPVNENDIKRRLCNELTANGALPKKMSKTNYFKNRSLEEIKADCSAILSLKECDFKGIEKGRKMKLYAVSDGPPSLAVRMTLKSLGIAYELVNVDYISAEHMSAAYEKMNPQKEIPVLDDDGFYLSESIAIMQYLCDKYAPSNPIYPKDAKTRALVNHRLCFNMGFYYASISMHAMAPIFFDYPRNEMTLKKVNNALSVFETYFQRSGFKYAAANHVTIADFALVSATLCLEGIGFDLSPYPLVKTWYGTFKLENPELWDIGNGGMQEIAHFEKNPPDLSHMNHPFHPTRKVKA